MSFVTLQNENLTVTICDQGAEIQSVKDASGVEYIWQTDGVYWAKHAPLLFPFGGALIDDIYTLEGKTYTLPKHGFVSDRLFAIESQTETAVTFLLQGEAAHHQNYPFTYELRARYTIDGCALKAETLVTNLGDGKMVYSAGAHEAYACPEGIEAYEVVFEEEEPLSRGVLSGGLLTRETRPVALQGKALPLCRSLFDISTVVLTALSSRSVTLQNAKGRRVRVDFPDFPYLLIWTQQDSTFLCIEPWHNLPDYIDSDQDFAQKPGIIAVAPGETSALTHTMTFSHA